MSSIDPKTRILEAAGEIFASYGYDAATVRQIGHLAGVNAAGINYYFGTKALLYAEALERACQSMVFQIPQTINNSDSPAEIIGLVIRKKVEQVLGEHSESWKNRLVRNEILHPTPIGKERVSRFIANNIHEFSSLLKAALPTPPEDGQLTKLTMSLFSQIFFFSANSQRFSSLMQQGQFDRNEFTFSSLIDHIEKTCLVILGLKKADWSSSADSAITVTTSGECDQKISEPEKPTGPNLPR
jgi:TetR/AcrR family transcriptional regulator, regulator of cefoperazone and chloramphenicol sensitivity